MLAGVVLFVAAPTSAFILAVYAARAGHQSGKIAVTVCGLLLLLAILLFSAWLYGGWVNVAVVAVMAAVAVLVSPGCAPATSRRPGRTVRNARRDRLRLLRRRAYLDRLRELTQPGRSSLTRHVHPARPGTSARSCSASQKARSGKLL